MSNDFFRWYDYKTTDRLPILEALFGGLDMEATDPRDKIFAILSFGEEIHDIVQLPPSAHPSYEKTTIEAFAEFTKWWISHNGTLDILSAVRTQPLRTWMDLLPLSGVARQFDFDLDHSQSQKPSWSLWYKGRSEWILGTLGLFNYSREELGFCASGQQTGVDQDVLASGPSTENTLVLKGFRVDIIKGKYIYSYCKREPHGNLKRMLAAYEAMFDPTSVLGTCDMMTKLNWQQFLATVAKLKLDKNDSDDIFANRAAWEEEAEKLKAHLGSHGF